MCIAHRRHKSCASDINKATRYKATLITICYLLRIHGSMLAIDDNIILLMFAAYRHITKFHCWERETLVHSLEPQSQGQKFWP